MKLILWMATSLNGMIARPNNEEDFLSEDTWLEWLRWIREVGCVIFGRKTYEVVKGYGEESLRDLKGIKIMVVSSQKDYKVSEGFELVSSPQEALEALERAGFQVAVLTGGSVLDSAFAKAGLIDEIVLNVEPVVVGEGIPLFSSSLFDLKLKLLETKKVNSNLIQIHYQVLGKPGLVSQFRLKENR